LTKKFYRRAKTRVIYVLKHRLIKDLIKTVVPVWAFIAGFALMFFSPLIGSALVLLVLALFLARTVQTMSITWPVARRKNVYLEYFVFLMARNFASGLGYTYGLVSMLGGENRRAKQVAPATGREDSIAEIVD